MNPVTLLRKINWHGTQTKLKNWQERDICHGFVGQKNRATLPGSINYPKQVHGKKIITAGQGSRPDLDEGDRISADGIFSATSGEVVGVRTADCLGILLYTEGAVMAVHAGWRGLAQGILGSAVDYFAKEGVAASALQVGFGPSISPGVYEVGPEVIEAIQNGNNTLTATEMGYSLTKAAGDRWHVDLATIGVFELLNFGVNPESIAVMRSCTYSEDNDWYSYRRNPKSSLRNWNWIRV